MKISVIIPTCGRLETLRACLLKLSPGAQSADQDSYEVVVTDDGLPGEQAGTMIAAEFAWARWTGGPRRGPAANRNHGAKVATETSELLVFLDDDCLPEPALLESYDRAFSERPELGAAEGRIIADREPERFDEVAPINESGGLFWSCNVAFRVKVFKELGGFDERFPHAVMEDVELRCRLRRAKIASRFVRSALVVHPLRRMEGWRTFRRHAAAHALYVRIESRDMTPFTWGHVLRRFGQSWIKRILPNVWRFRGRGFWWRARASFAPFLMAWEMKKADRLPKLPKWTGPDTAKL